MHHFSLSKINSGLLKIGFVALTLFGASTSYGNACVSYYSNPWVLSESSPKISVIKDVLAEISKDKQLSNLIKQNPDLIAYITFTHLLPETAPVVREFSRVLALHSYRYYTKQSKNTYDNASYMTVVDYAVKQGMTNPKIKTQLETLAKVQVEETLNIAPIAKLIDPKSYYGRANFWAQLHELGKFVKVQKGLAKETDREMALPVMDSALIALDGYLRSPKISEYQVRQWTDGKQMSDISASDVTGNLNMFIAATRMSYEVEAPFVDPSTGYPWETSVYLHKTMPLLAEFVGKDTQEVEANGVCTRSWCREERRHPGVWLKALSQILGRKVTGEELSGNPVDPIDFSEAGLLKHVKDRVTSEIGAASSYLAKSQMAKGPMKAVISEVYRDELKHLAIFGSAAQYLEGYRPWYRRIHIIKTLIEYGDRHKQGRSNGDELGPQQFGALLPFGASIMMVESRIQKYLATVPLSILRKTYEGESNRPKDPNNRTEEEAKTLKIEQTKEDLNRLVLSRWIPEQRAKYLALEIFSAVNSEGINSLIQSRQVDAFGQMSKTNTVDYYNTMVKAVKAKIGKADLKDFAAIDAQHLEARMKVIEDKLAELIGPAAAAEHVAGIRKDIPKLKAPSVEMLQDAVISTLRERQFTNNPYHQEVLAKSAAK